MSIPRKARETALRMLFQWEMSKEAPERAKELYWQHAKAEAPVRSIANSLFDGVVERLESIDNLLRAHSEHWRLERMSAVDRNILRVAVCEFLTRSDVTPAIAINEALEIARRYSTDESARFINGVLDAIRRAQGLPAPPAE